MTEAKDFSDLPTRAQLLSMSGYEFMCAMRDGTLPRPPIARLLRYELTEVSDGSVTFSGTPEFDHTNPMGGLHGGWYGAVLDSCMACAVMTKVPQGCIYTTLEYKVNITRSIPIGQPVVAHGWVQHAGRSTGVAAGEIRDAEDGKLYATGSTTCIIMQIDAAPRPPIRDAGMKRL
ncbi:PaaI family thioesterase [uncultured Planktomarina sp.]|uniref:PaaI family thioesterase n=1 Tax=uncultured Planktomarina sp. TaxID=1538529 RepID=UPI0032602CA3